MRRPVAPLALVVALALGTAAGCGGGGSGHADDYVKAVNDAQDGLARRFDRLQSGVGATSTPAQDSRTLRGYEAAVQEAVTRLRAVEPPSGVRRLHDEFVGEISDYGNEVRRARDALATGARGGALAARGRLVTEVARITARIDDTIGQINRRLRG